MIGIRRAFALSFAQRYVAYAIQFVSTIIMSRLLAPREVGVFALAAAVVAVAHLLRDFAVGEYIIQERDLTKDRVRVAFAVTLTIAWTLAAALYLFAPLATELYHEPGVAKVLRVLAMNFVFLPFGSTCFAIMSKKMDFGAIFVVQTASALTSAVSGIALAYLGFSYMSMAWSSLVGIVTTILLLAVLRPEDVFILPKFSGSRRVIAFSTILTGSALIDQLSQRAPDFVIGKVLGFEALGLFSRGQGLSLVFGDLFINAILRVVKPMFASVERTPESLRSAYLASVSKLAGMPTLFFGFAILFAEDIVLFLFGAGWKESAVLLRIFSINMLASIPYFLTSSLLMATGRPRYLLLLSIGRIAVVVLTLSICTPFGLEVTVWGLVGGSLIMLIGLHMALHEITGIRIREIFECCRPSLVMAVPALAIALLAKGLPLPETSLQAMGRLTLGWILMLVAAAAVGTRIDHPLKFEVTLLWRTLKQQWQRFCG